MKKSIFAVIALGFIGTCVSIAFAEESKKGGETDTPDTAQRDNTHRERPGYKAEEKCRTDSNGNLVCDK